MTTRPAGGFDVRELPALIEQPEFLARTGRPVLPPRAVRLGEEPQPPELPEGLRALDATTEPGVRSTHRDVPDDPPAPRLHQKVWEAVRTDRQVVGYGEWGVFAVELSGGGTPGSGTADFWPDRPLLRPHCTVAPAGVPAEARRPTPAWLERHFGPASLWRPEPEALPAELRHEPSRRFLLEVGFPLVDGTFTLHSRQLADHGPAPLAVPLRTVTRHGAPIGELSGRPLLLGRWMFRHLVLDGTTGRLYVLGQDPPGPGGHDPGRPAGLELCASSIEAFVAVLRLCSSYRYDSTVTGDPRPPAAPARLLGWIGELDPAPGAVEHWSALLTDSLVHEAFADAARRTGRFLAKPPAHPMAHTEHYR
ncbi:SUKH-4 family immunity protein [Kitasatospora sp. KL5]|uniref:SUKH-4 family immunity protein n=1 Tax=Kitasatospora sp. KL5 TaxID=3425125 RepID=UPI003D6FA279